MLLKVSFENKNTKVFQLFSKIVFILFYSKLNHFRWIVFYKFLEFSKLFFSNRFLIILQFSDNFVHFKRLEGGVYFVKSLPITKSGKIVRHLVTEMAINLWEMRKNVSI